MRKTKKFDSSKSSVRMFFSAASILSCCHLASAQEVAGGIGGTVLLKSIDGELIDTEYFSIPTAADIDGDGKTDLVVGQFMNHNAPWLRKPGGSGCAGTVRWYRNESKGDALPTYAPGADLKSDGGLLYAANW